MPPRTTPGSRELGEAIRARREELNMSIEDAAQRAGVGSETWRRYEVGSNIRQDKVRSICGALRWRTLPAGPTGETDDNAEENHWATFDVRASDWYVEELELNYGVDAAKLFAWGSTAVLDEIQQDLDELSRKPRGTHLGELDVSWIDGDLPPQWLTRYDYAFLFRLKATVEQLRRQAVEAGSVLTPRLGQTIGEAIGLRLIMSQGDVYVDLYDSDTGDWEDWLDDMVEFDWILPLMYAGQYVDDPGPFGIDNWFARPSASARPPVT